MAARRRSRANELSVADQFVDALVRHQIGILRYTSSTSRRINRLLDATEADLRRAIRDRLRRARGLDRPSDVTRLERLLDEVRAVRRASWSEARVFIETEMAALAVQEAAVIDGITKTVVPVVLDTTLPPARLLRDMATTRPLRGKTVREWFANLEDADIDRIETQVKIGLIERETPRQISRRVVGTASTQGRDGVTQMTRRQVDAVVRTAGNGIANESRRRYYLENADVFDREVYVATLDSRTTPICRALDGKLFPVGEGPYPPRHVNCRSTRAPAPSGELIGNRPMKPVTERQLLREFAEREGLGVVRSRDALPFGTKGAFDRYARQRVRELTEVVPSTVNYRDFLLRQSVENQEAILGATKARLFRRGGLSLERMVDLDTGVEKTLRQIALDDRQAFTRAGLDPADYL